MTGSVDFFFYGTLRDAEVRRTVLGPMARPEAVVAAELAGYRCAPVGTGAFPALVVERKARAEGLLVTGVDLTSAARVSLFEDEGYDYRVQRVSVTDRDEAEREAWAFLPTARLPVQNGVWDIDEWSRRHKAAFLANARRAMSQIGGQLIERSRRDWIGRIGTPRP